MQGGDFNLYEGMRCHGVPLVTISRGRLVCENGVFMCAEGSGKFYPQRTFPDYLYKKMVQREKVRSLPPPVSAQLVKVNQRECAESAGSQRSRHVESDSADLTGSRGFGADALFMR